MAEIVRYPCVEQLEIAPFTSPLVTEQITRLTGAAPNAETVARVMERTQGNPYFVEQLVAADGLDDRALPSSLRELLLLRADVVSPVARRTLRVLSLADDNIGDEALARVVGASIDEVRGHVRDAVDRLLLVASQDGVTFAHALLREALHDDLLPGERTSYHAAFAAELEHSTAGGAGPLARLAHHREGAGDITGAIEAWGAAATAAESVFAFAEAHLHLDRIIENWDRAPSAGALVGARFADVIARTAEDAFLGGDPEAARDLVRRAIALLDLGDDSQTVGLLYERLARYLRDTAEHEQAFDAIQRALDLVPGDPPSVGRARVLAGVAGHLMRQGRYDEAKAPAAEAVDLARQVGAAAVEADALITLGVLTCTTDDVDRGLAMMRSALDLAQRGQDAHQQMRAHWNTFACLSDAGAWEQALAAFHDLSVHLPRLGQEHVLSERYAIGADILMRLGRWDEALATIEEARQRFPTGTEVAELTDLLVERGEFDEARRVITAKTTRNVFLDQEQQGWPLVNLAQLETWEGDHGAARLAVDAALQVTADLDAPLATLYALTVGCRCEADADELARWRGLVDDEDVACTRASSFVKQLDDMLARPGPENGWKREARVLARQGAAELSRARGTSDSDAWAGATGDWERLGMPYHAAYTRFRCAEADFVETGDRDVAGALLGEAHRVATDLGADPLRRLVEGFARRSRIDIGLPDGDGAAGRLSPREREVLALLADGASNRRIARTLFIGEKTASVHVSNIMRKLGASNRGEAVAAARREGLTP